MIPECVLRQRRREDSGLPLTAAPSRNRSACRQSNESAGGTPSGCSTAGDRLGTGGGCRLPVADGERPVVASRSGYRLHGAGRRRRRSAHAVDNGNDAEHSVVYRRYHGHWCGDGQRTLVALADIHHANVNQLGQRRSGDSPESLAAIE